MISFQYQYRYEIESIHFKQLILPQEHRVDPFLCFSASVAKKPLTVSVFFYPLQYQSNCILHSYPKFPLGAYEVLYDIRRSER